MSTGNARPSNNDKQPPNSPVQMLQSTECKQLTDIGLCVLVCDCKVTYLLEWMFAHNFSEKNNWRRMSLTKQLCEQLPTYMKDEGDRKKLEEKLRIGNLDRMEANELKRHLKYTMRLTLYELQCALLALSGDEYQLVCDKVRSLRKTRNDVVHKNYKFKDEEERKAFLTTYKEFIKKYNFKEYFGSSHAETKEKCSQLSRNYEDLVKMLSEYNEIQKEWKKEKDECEECFKKLKEERNQLENRAVTLKAELQKEKADSRHIRETLNKESNQWREQAEDHQEAHKRLKEDYKTLEANFNTELEAKTLLRQQHSEKDKKIDKLEKEKKSVTDQINAINKGLSYERRELKKKENVISKLDQEIERLNYQAGKDSDSISELGDQNDELKERMMKQGKKIDALNKQVMTLKEQLGRCRCNVDQTDAQVQPTS